ncbi:MAG: DUF4160 domain-containing protein [Desulfamplus sp.]|nr:DUF4160 domain-containing protein [Desulfamplus sp.]
MPELARFYGLIIYMFAKDHCPPHFHAKYNEHKAMINIENGELISGYLPRRALRLVQDWVEINQAALLLME